MTLEVLDPTYDDAVTALAPASRSSSLRGAVVGIVSNGKQGTGRFFDALSEELTTTYGAARVDRVVKPNYSAPVPAGMLDQAQEWNALISGIGD